jgi:hypothetical protein
MIDKKVEEKKPVAEPQRPGATIRYLDRPDCLETFADSITGVTFDGQTLRLEFSVTPHGRCEAEFAGHRPALSSLPPGAAAARRG